MRKILYFALSAFFAAGCGSDSANVASNAKINNNSSAVSVNAPVVTQMNALPPPAVKQSNANAGNTADANQTVQDVSSVSLKNLERLKSKGGGGDPNAAPIPSIKATPNPAPDNSEISSTMTAKGVPIETRVFKNNPTLLKIERTFEDVGNPVTKVYLKNGKVLTVPKGALQKPESASADEILRAAGVKP